MTVHGCLVADVVDDVVVHPFVTGSRVGWVLVLLVDSGEEA